MRTDAARLGVVLVALVVAGALSGCKRKQPPKATRVWLDERHGCASFANGELRCWGAGHAPELVPSDPLTRGDETSLPLPAGIAWADVANAAYGASHSCLALKNGSVRCWGKNANGELGDGTRNDSDAPVPVHGLGDVADVRAGAHHTCARLVNKTVSCWGRNDRHQLANGTTEASSRPVPLFGLVGVEELAVAGDSGCVRLGDGDIRCWGANDAGQLGDATRPDHDVPASIRFHR